MNKKRGLILLCLYGALVLYITLFAWNYGASFESNGFAGRNYNYYPFRSIYRIAVYSPSIIDPFFILFGNIVLFMPLGFLLPLLFSPFQTMTRTVAASLAGSALIEIGQFAFTHRVADVDDLLLNTAGGFIGYCGYRVVIFFKKRVFYF